MLNQQSAHVLFIYKLQDNSIKSSYLENRIATGCLEEYKHGELIKCYLLQTNFYKKKFNIRSRRTTYKKHKRGHEVN